MQLKLRQRLTRRLRAQALRDRGLAQAAKLDRFGEDLDGA